MSHRTNGSGRSNVHRDELVFIDPCLENSDATLEILEGETHFLGVGRIAALDADTLPGALDGLNRDPFVNNDLLTHFRFTEMSKISMTTSQLIMPAIRK